MPAASSPPAPPVLPPPRPVAAKAPVPSTGVPASIPDRAGSEATPLPPPPVSVAAPAPKPFPAGPAIKPKPVAPEAEPAVFAPVVVAPVVAAPVAPPVATAPASVVAPATASVVVAPVVESDLAAAMAEPPRRANLASGSSAYPDSIEREIAARRDGSPLLAEATQNVRVETGVDVNDDSSARVAEPRRRKGVPFVVIAGGAGAVLVAAVIAVFAMRGGGSDDKRDGVSANETSAKTREHELPDTTDTRPAGDTPGTGSSMRIDDTRAKPANAAAGSADEAPAPTPEPVVEPEPPTPMPPVQPPAPVAPKKTPTLGGKKVVLEYDSGAPKETPKKTAPAKGDDSAAVGAARITYFNGNRKLFAGDADGAIKLYKQALAVYPGYVAGYRGLGLAYAQKGDKANALKSFRTYLSAVPGAKDAALIKKRIATLQR